MKDTTFRTCLSAHTRFIGQVPDTGFKVELFLTSTDPHDQARFRRRKRHPFLDGHAYLPSPEDVIIQKLRWYARAKRSKDFEDGRNVLAVQMNHLDLDYIRQWADIHGTRILFEQLLNSVNPPA